MKKVRKIEVPQKDTIRKLRVAAYCRVSTKYESQKSSIELQKEYYESYIKEQPNWLFAGVYVDYGSRVRIDKRAAFQKMIQKAVNGEIDCIITKSISRFSGNTVDMLQTIRLLKEKGVTVWFEKENIRSTDENMELAITIHTMLAQEEIRNMSENIQWGFKRRFEQGVTLNNYKYFYGYPVIKRGIDREHKNKAKTTIKMFGLDGEKVLELAKEQLAVRYPEELQSIIEVISSHRPD